MITQAHLKSRPDMCQDLKLPEAWEISGAYPTRYCIRYHADEGDYTVSMESFVYRNATEAGPRVAPLRNPHVGHPLRMHRTTIEGDAPR